MTEQEMEKLLQERYAEFHRKEEPDTIIRRFNDYGYFHALDEAKELKTVQIPGTFFAQKDPDTIIRAIFAEGGKLIEETDENGVTKFTGFFPHDTKLPREERVKHPPMLFICWADGQNLCFVAKGKNPPENEFALRDATDLFLQKAETFDAMDEIPEIREKEKPGDDLTHTQKIVMAVITIVVLLLIVIFLIFK